MRLGFTPEILPAQEVKAATNSAEGSGGVDRERARLPEGLLTPRLAAATLRKWETNVTGREIFFERQNGAKYWNTNRSRA